MEDIWQKEDCKKLIEEWWDGISATDCTEEDKWIKFPNKIESVLAWPELGISLLAKFGQLETTEEKYIRVKVNSGDLRQRLLTLATETGLEVRLDIKEINLALKFYPVAGGVDPAREDMGLQGDIAGPSTLFEGVVEFEREAERKMKTKKT